MRRIAILALGLLACSDATTSGSTSTSFDCGDAGLQCVTATQGCGIVTTTGGVDGGANPSTYSVCEDFGACKSCDCMGASSALGCNSYTCSETNGAVTLRYEFCD